MAKEVFKDFPSKETLPPNLRMQMKRGIQNTKEAMGEIHAAMEAGSIPFSTGYKMTGEFFAHWIMTIVASGNLGIPPQWDLQDLIYPQEIIMSFAHFDVFFADSVRAICQICPEILKRNKQTDWGTILSCGNWEALLNYFTEQYVYEIGWKSIPKRIEFLKDKLGLVFSLSEPEIIFLEEAEQVRHILTHNGGKINQEFLVKTGRDDLVIGEYYKVTPAFTRKVSFTILGLASAIFESVSRKFFAIEDSRIKQQVLKLSKKLMDSSK